MAAARAARNTPKGLPVSPLAPAGGFPAIPPIAGLRLAATAAGVRYQGRDDVMLAVMDPGTVLAGVTTSSATRAAPVLDIEAKLAGPAHGDGGAAFLVNAGNANAFTGGTGMQSVEELVTATAAATGVAPERVLTCSTGVIGERLPHERITAALGGLEAALSPEAWAPAAAAIMTTDTFPKGAVRQVDTPDGPVQIAGFAKGSGMIAPDMATMLVFLFTDARISQPALQTLVSQSVPSSFNAITVDSDTSTSDTLLMAATGQAGSDLDAAPSAMEGFAAALSDLMQDLARQVVCDGEGASKLITIDVTGAADDADAHRAAMAIANSPLVKTAIAGEDPNWGRIVMAIGKSGAAADRDRLSIRFGEIEVARDGWVSPEYREEDGAAYMQRSEIEITVALGLGAGQARVWTCDLTHAYISINADYRS
ncbi:MAG: bifunctional glutamate N-acetyltransferase/amino-acid acetyltransferase ArgJ [Mangrovicoccus sp.]|nr:bifunctional glutamate N-acetyltransferase/amino-acid acetyltransferase ArgJ [Mangrovicoccus sp.]